MNNNFYTIYHLHSDFSNGTTNIDSITKFHRYINKAKECGMKAMCFSEHGNIFSWVKKKQETEKAGLKYIHGSEFYLTESIDTKIDEKGKDILDLKRDNYHLILIAKNYEGVKELNILSSKSFNRQDGHFYYRPRITFEELFNTSDNIIVTSSCLGGVLNRGSVDIKKRFLKFFIENKHRCFLEIQHHNVREQKEYNKQLYEISKRFNISLIAGTDTHCLDDNDVEGRLILQKSKNVFFEGEDGWDIKFKTYEELVDAYKRQNCLPEEVYIKAIENTNVMSDMVEEFKLDYSHKYPKLYKNSESVFKNKIAQGIKEKGIDKYPNYDEYKKRIVEEYDTYIHNGAIDYLLLEEDYKREMRKKGIYCGHSRGSSSGSLICYLLGITEVDSLRWGLNFARFMHKERVNLADIDSDWYKDDRPIIKDYLYNKPNIHCCDIITYNTIAIKGAIKDVGRALGMSVEETQMISDAVEDNKPNELHVKKYPELFRLVDIVKDVIVSIGTHPAGTVVSPYVVEEWFGSCTTSTNDRIVSQINMKELDNLNFVKLDILLLDAVGLINKTCELANIERPNTTTMDYEEKIIWDEIAEDNTMIFQFESDFAGGYIKDLLRKETIEKIKKINPNFSYLYLASMANGAIRPSGESYRDSLLNGDSFNMGNKDINNFFKDTLGWCIFQEQIMGFLHEFCNFTMGEADMVRRGLSKKLGTEQFIPDIKKGFVKFAKEHWDMDKEEALKTVEPVIQVIINSAEYGFSINHSQIYSMIGFEIGWLRHYYPLETLTVALNIYATDEAKLSKITSYAGRNNIYINPIRFGKSSAEYTMDKPTNSIYKGIASIKYLNSKVAEELLTLSQQNTYPHTIQGFIQLLKDIKTETSTNTRQLDILITLDFFKDFGENQYLLNILKMYDEFMDSKIIQKKKLDYYYENYNITEYDLKQYSSKETKSQFRDIDNIGLINYCCSKLENKPMLMIEQMQKEQDWLGYILYTNPNINHNLYVVIEYREYKEGSKPYITLRRISDGEEIKTKTNGMKYFKEHPFGLWSVLEVNSFLEKNKVKKVGDEFVKQEELELVLSEYNVIKNDIE